MVSSSTFLGSVKSVIDISARGICTGADTENEQLVPALGDADVKMTPLGPYGRHRNRMNGEPIVVDLCDSASHQGGFKSCQG